MGRVWRFLTRMPLAVSLLLMLLLITLIGSFFPQLPTVFARDPARYAAWLEAARERYGPAFPLLLHLGFFFLSHSWLLLLALGLVGLTTLLCTLDRWRGVWRAAFHRPLHRVGEGSHTVILSAVPSERLRATLEAEGYRVQVETREDAVRLRADRYSLSSLATLVTHLAVVLLLIAFGLSTWGGYRDRLNIGPGETALLQREGLVIRNDGLSIAHYPGCLLYTSPSPRD